MWHQFSNIFASFCFVGGPVLCKGHLFSCVYFLNSVSSPPSYSSVIKINKHNNVLSSEGLSDRQKKNCLLAFLSNQLLMENNAVCLCVCSRQGTYLYVNMCCPLWVQRSYSVKWSPYRTPPHSQHTHAHTHSRGPEIFRFFLQTHASSRAGWLACVCEARLFRTCRPCKSLPGAGLHVEIPKRRGLGHASVLITRVHICRGCTQITPTRILMIICYQASLSLPTCHSNTHALSPCIRWRPAWQEKKGASRGNPEAVRSITQQH